jgi:hypothetical protein
MATREIPIPQAMQRHTGCAWVQPVRAADRDEKTKKDAAVADRVVEPEKT